MKVRNIKWTLPFIAVICLTSCYSYKPGYINSPKFEESKELNLGGSIGSNFGANASYNPIDRLALMAEFSSGLNVGGDFDSSYLNQDRLAVTEYQYQDYAYGLAVGTYWKYNENLYHDLYLGYGRGKGSAYTQLNLVYPEVAFELVALEGSYSNFFLQSSFTASVSNEVDLSLNSRINILNFHSFNYIFDEETTKTNSQNRINSFFQDRNQIAAQLGLTVTFKLNHFTIFTQFQLGVTEEDGNQPDYFEVRPINFYVGFSIPLNQLWETE